MNERLRNILSETVMTTMSTEERINRQLANLVAEGRKSPGSRSRHGGADTWGEAGEELFTVNNRICLGDNRK